MRSFLYLSSDVANGFRSSADTDLVYFLSTWVKQYVDIDYSEHVRKIHDAVIKWKHFPRYCPFMRGIHRSPVNSPNNGQWGGALMFSLVRLNKRLGKQSKCWWFEAPSRSSWRHCNVISTVKNIGIDTNIEVIVVSLTTWEAHHSPRAKPEGCGELPRSLMRQQWPKLRYQFLFFHDETKLMMNKQILSI